MDSQCLSVLFAFIVCQCRYNSRGFNVNPSSNTYCWLIKLSFDLLASRASTCIACLPVVNFTGIFISTGSYVMHLTCIQCVLRSGSVCLPGYIPNLGSLIFW